MSEKHTGRIYYGLDQSKSKLVHISSSLNGNSCNLHCFVCESPLSAKQGKIQQHHFAHQSVDKSKRSCYESNLHIVSKLLFGTGGKFVYSFQNEIEVVNKENFFDNFKIKEPTALSFLPIKMQIEKEVDLERIRSDTLVTCVVDDLFKEDIIIEIFVTHKVDDLKLEKIKRTGMTCIEIDMSDLIGTNFSETEILEQLYSQRRMTFLNSSNELKKYIVNKIIPVGYDHLLYTNEQYEKYALHFEKYIIGKEFKIPKIGNLFFKDENMREVPLVIKDDRYIVNSVKNVSGDLEVTVSTQNRSTVFNINMTGSNNHVVSRSTLGCMETGFLHPDKIQNLLFWSHNSKTEAMRKIVSNNFFMYFCDRIENYFSIKINKDEISRQEGAFNKVSSIISQASTILLNKEREIDKTAISQRVDLLVFNQLKKAEYIHVDKFSQTIVKSLPLELPTSQNILRIERIIASNNHLFTSDNDQESLLKIFSKFTKNRLNIHKLIVDSLVSQINIYGKTNDDTISKYNNLINYSPVIEDGNSIVFARIGVKIRAINNHLGIRTKFINNETDAISSIESIIYNLHNFRIKISSACLKTMLDNIVVSYVKSTLNISITEINSIIKSQPWSIELKNTIYIIQENFNQIGIESLKVGLSSKIHIKLHEATTILNDYIERYNPNDTLRLFLENNSAFISGGIRGYNDNLTEMTTSDILLSFRSLPFYEEDGEHVNGQWIASNFSTGNNPIVFFLKYPKHELSNKVLRDQDKKNKEQSINNKIGRSSHTLNSLKLIINEFFDFTRLSNIIDNYLFKLELSGYENTLAFKMLKSKYEVFSSMDQIHPYVSQFVDGMVADSVLLITDEGDFKWPSEKELQQYLISLDHDTITK